MSEYTMEASGCAAVEGAATIDPIADVSANDKHTIVAAAQDDSHSYCPGCYIGSEVVDGPIQCEEPRADRALEYTARMTGGRRSWMATVHYYHSIGGVRSREFARMCACFIPEFRREYVYCMDSRILRYRLNACLFGLASGCLLDRDGVDDDGNEVDEWIECYETARKYVRNARNLLGSAAVVLKYPQTDMWIKAINVRISMEYEGVDAIVI